MADGPSDRCLLRIIDWLLASLRNVSPLAIKPQFADSRRLPGRPPTLSERMRQALDYYPCDILFVHRDAEREPLKNRLREIELAADEAQIHHRVPVIPVRMMEAWLLLEIRAIRTAADNPNGTARLDLPRVQELESVPDPKRMLYDLLIAASEKTGRRLAHFRSPANLAMRRIRVADLIADFSLLRQLPAFSYFAAETNRVVQAWYTADQR